MAHVLQRPANAAAASNAAGLFVRRLGQTGSPILLLHGLASSSRYWLPGAARLSDDHRLIVPDLLGFGRSPKPFHSTYSLEEHVDRLHRAVAPLTGEPMALIGHSMGALVALQYAITHRDSVSHVILISLPMIGCLPWGHRADGQPARVHRIIAHTSAGARAAGLALRLVGPVAQYVAQRMQRDVPPEAARDALRVTGASYWRTLEHVVYGTDAAALVDRLSSPLLIIQGERDRTVPIEPVRELVAAHLEIRLQVLPDAGHNPWFTHNAQTVELIRRFID